MKSWRVVLTMCAVMLLGATSAAWSAGPLLIPQPYLLKAKLKVDGVEKTGSDPSFVLKVKKQATNTDYAPVDASGDTFGEAIAGRFTYNTPIFDNADQPGGATPGEKACLEVWKNGQKLSMTIPAKGNCPVGSGELTIGNSGESIGFGGIAGTTSVVDPITVTTPAPEITVTPMTVAFGNVNLGASATQTVNIRNDGTTDLHVTGLTISGSGFTIIDPVPPTPASPISIVPSASRNVTLQFLPVSKGNAPGTLTILSDDADEGTVNVTLSAAGVARLELVQGWNLIGLPAQPGNTNPGTIFAEIIQDVVIVWGYTNGSWKFYDPSDVAGSTLNSMNLGKGYWIKLRNARNIIIN